MARPARPRGSPGGRRGEAAPGQEIRRDCATRSRPAAAQEAAPRRDAGRRKRGVHPLRPARPRLAPDDRGARPPNLDGEPASRVRGGGGLRARALDSRGRSARSARLGQPEAAGGARGFDRCSESIRSADSSGRVVLPPRALRTSFVPVPCRSGVADGKDLAHPCPVGSGKRVARRRSLLASGALADPAPAVLRDRACAGRPAGADTGSGSPGTTRSPGMRATLPG